MTKSKSKPRKKAQPKKKKVEYVYMASVDGKNLTSIFAGDFGFKFKGQMPWKVKPEILEKIQEFFPGLVKEVSAKWKP